jgi:hypothetical protein
MDNRCFVGSRPPGILLRLLDLYGQGRAETASGMCGDKRSHDN